MKGTSQLLLLLVFLVYMFVIYAEDCPLHCKCDIAKRLADCSSDGLLRHLKTIPAIVPSYTEILILDHNNISSIYNNSLAHLWNLKTLSAKDCMIKHIDNGVFKNLNKITKIHLEQNKLHNFTVLHKLPVLSYLNLSKNYINRYQNISVCELPALATLDLSSNLIETSALPNNFRCLRNLSTFVLDHNYLQNIDDTDFLPLANSFIRNLSICQCSLRFITGDALTSIRNVTRLNLSYNLFALNSTAFQDSMQALCPLSSLQHLNLEHNQITKYTVQSFKCLRNLKYLNLRFNNIVDLPANGFEGLISLVDLNLSINKIRTIQEAAFKGLYQLRTLLMSNNQLVTIPANIFASKTNESYMPNIEMINFHYSRIEFLQNGHFKGLYNLRKLDIGFNEITSLRYSVFEGLNSLTHLTIKYNHLKRISRTAFRPLNNTLVYLNLEGNRYLLSFSFLKHIPRITDLNLSNNKFGVVSRLETLIPKQMRNTLRRLFMRTMSIRKIPVETFTGMHNLQKLDLSDNNIVSWDPKVFANLPSLANLWLKNNDIRILNESSLGHVWYQLTNFLADHNQYACDCDLLWFLNWIKNATKHNVKVPVSSVDVYVCASPETMAQKSIFEYKPKNLECTAWWWIVTPSVTGFLLLLLLSITLGCCYRYHLRLCCFRNFGIGYKDYEALDGEECNYDAFISYSQDDMAWVIQILVKTLEGKSGFKVFFEDRDYILGETMVDNIISGIESSRRVIIVLSQSFLEGQWCGLEVQLIQKKLLKKLIVIKRDDVSDFELSPTLGWIIRERIFIEWNEHPVAQELFWEQLNHAIEENPDKPRLCAIC